MAIFKVIYMFKNSAVLYSSMLAMTAVSSLMKSISPLYIREFFNILSAGKFDTKTLLIIVFLETFSVFFTVVLKSLTYVIKGTLTGNILTKFSERNLGSSFDSKIATKAASLTNKIVSGVSESQGGAVLSILKVILFVALAFKMDLVVGSLILVFFSLSVILMLVHLRKFSRMYSHVLEKETNLKHHTIDTLKGREDILAFCSVDSEMEKFGEKSKELSNLQQKLYTLEFKFNEFLQRIINISLFFLILLRGFAAKDAGLMIAGARYFSLVSAERRSFLYAIDSLKEGNKAAQGLLKLL